MSTSDKIQLTIAVVAGLSSLLAAISIILNYIQNKNQKEQWRLQFVPHFKFLYFAKAVGTKFFFILENTNQVPYYIEEYYFSDHSLEIELITNGAIAKPKTTGVEGEYRGITLVLEVDRPDIIVGRLHLVVRDALNIQHKLESNIIKFQNYKHINDFTLGNTYFKKI